MKNIENNIKNNAEEGNSDEMSYLKLILYGGTLLFIGGLYFKLEPSLGRSNTLIIIGAVLILLYWIYIYLFKK